MNLDSLTLGEIKQLKSLLTSEPQDTTEVFKGKKIVILQRGWVFVGDFYQKGYDCTLKNASCIRRWGTTNGLGELAQKGPLPETKLEPALDITFHKFTEVASMSVNEDKWK